MTRLILGVSLLSFVAIGLSAENTAKVTVSVTSSLGDALPAEIHLYRLGSPEDLWAKKRSGDHVAEEIPFGWYQLQVLSPGFRKYERDLVIVDPETHVRAVMAVSGESTGPVELSGRLLYSDSRASTWVLALPLQGSPADAIESLVSANGSFRIRTVNPGWYLLAVVRGDQALKTQEVYIGAGSAELVIDLPH
jgi:hypothetical protein